MKEPVALHLLLVCRPLLIVLPTSSAISVNSFLGGVRSLASLFVSSSPGVWQEEERWLPSFNFLPDGMIPRRLRGGRDRAFFISGEKFLPQRGRKRDPMIFLFD
ncbi:unnamed protein product [Linum trigynum]|uniref:Secreted protein n=1 Tax=Linum trigynum TaxID=586398 RepID=A0AAV2GM74_9ROSI